MSFLKNMFGFSEAEPLEVDEVEEGIAKILEEYETQSQCRTDLEQLYPERQKVARRIIEFVIKMRGPRQVTRPARECIQQLKSLTPKDKDAIFDVDELTTKVNVSYTGPRRVPIELSSRSKSAESLSALLDEVLDQLGSKLDIC